MAYITSAQFFGEPNSQGPLLVKGDFWNAGLGYRPSHAWRSLLRGRDLLKIGCLWRVGNGEKINIWGDKWLPKSSSSITTQPTILSPTAKVSDLIEPDTRTWRNGLLGQLFSSGKALEISNIPLGMQPMEDSIYWTKTACGEFTVKSGTRLARDIDGARSKRIDEGSSVEHDGRCETLWSSQTVPRAKNLCWRACRDALPSCVNLYKKGIELDVYCPVCGEEYETVTHIFLDCQQAREVWAKSLLRIDISKRAYKDFADWCHDFFTKVSAEIRGLSINIMWGLWTARNRWVFDHVRSDCRRIITKAEDDWHALLDACEREQKPYNSVGAAEPRWTAPTRNCYKANVDAAIGENGIRGVDLVVRDVAGDIMATASFGFKADWDVATTEACAVVCGMRISKEAGLDNLEMETDSLITALAINRKQVGYNYVVVFINDALNFIESLNAFSICHVNRRANSVAHELARFALVHGEERIWLEEGPECITSLIEAEKPCNIS